MPPDFNADIEWRDGQVINAQKLGAKAVIIVNTDDKSTLRLKALPGRVGPLYDLVTSTSPIPSQTKSP